MSMFDSPPTAPLVLASDRPSRMRGLPLERKPSHHITTDLANVE